MLGRAEAGPPAEVDAGVEVVVIEEPEAEAEVVLEAEAKVVPEA